MNEPLPPLKRFERRVRLVRTWRGIAIGACVGGAVAMVAASLDFFGAAYTDPIRLSALVVGGGIAGAVINLLRKVPTSDLAKSIDRRARLNDRLSTSQERAHSAGSMDDALRADADARIQAVSAKEIYPVRVDRWHAGAVALMASTAAVFLLGNSPILLDASKRQEQQEVRQEAAKVERVRRENFETPEAAKELSEAERRLAEEMRQLQAEMERARMSKEESRQKSNALAEKAEQLQREQSRAAETSLDQAETALTKLAKAELDKAGLKEVDPQLAQMTSAEREQAEFEAQDQLAKSVEEASNLQSRIDALNQKLANPNLTDAQRKELQSQKQNLEQRRAEAAANAKSAEARMKSLQLSREAQEVLRKMQNHPLYKELQELAKKLRQAAKDGQSGSKRPPLTEAQRKEIQRKLEELARKLSDDKAMQEYLKKLIEAMKSVNGACRSCSTCLGLGLGLSLPIPGGPGPDDDQMSFDTGRVQKLDKAAAGAGKTAPAMISGQRQPGAPESYIEIKAPTSVGTRTSIPYVKVLPSYRRKAESALNRQQIPKEHERRVREYFGGLGN